MMPEKSKRAAELLRCAAGQVIADRYELLEELGRGGYGIVYRARDRSLGREVALKLLLVEASGAAEDLERFRREVRAAAALQHPGIIELFDVGDCEGKPFYVMQLIRGKELSAAIRDHDLSPRDAIELTRQIAEALQFAHARGVLHRDIKPHNIIVQRFETSASPSSDAVEASRASSFEPPARSRSKAKDKDSRSETGDGATHRLETAKPATSSSKRA